MVSGHRQVPLGAPCFSLIHQGFCGYATTISPMWTPMITPQPEEKLQGGHAQVQSHTAIPTHSALRNLGDPLHQQDRPHSQTQALFVGHHSSLRSQPSHNSTRYLSSAPGGAHVWQQDGRMQGEGQPLTRPSHTHPGPAKSPQLGFGCPKHQTYRNMCALCRCVLACAHVHVCKIKSNKL